MPFAGAFANGFVLEKRTHFGGGSVVAETTEIAADDSGVSFDSACPSTPRLRRDSLLCAARGSRDGDVPSTFWGVDSTSI